MTANSSKRAALLVLVTVAGLIVILRWSGGSNAPGGGSGFATPAACLDAYRDAVQEGDAAAYLLCLGEPLRSETRRHHLGDAELAEALRRQMRGVKSWVVSESPEERGDRASAIVEEVRSSGVRAVRFQLARSGAGWLIVGIDRGDERAAGIPYGTRVGNEAETKP
jgi:hypothetical protein